MYPSIALMFLLCFLDNIIYLEEGKNGNISWNTTVKRPQYNVTFNQLSNQTNDIIYTKGVLKKNSTKYKHLTRIGYHIQFTLTQVSKSDVGLYKSLVAWNWISWKPSIDGCAFLVMEGM